MSDQFFEQGTRLLTPSAFEFVLDGEMKRAVRSQSFLTLVMLEARREWDGMMVTADEGTVGDVASTGSQRKNCDPFPTSLCTVRLPCTIANSRLPVV